jgi:hypothetical protein
MFGVLKQFEVRRRIRRQSNVARSRKGVEGILRAFGSQILRHRALDVLHRHRGPPAAEGRRHRGQNAGCEQVRLHPLDRGRLARERQQHVGQDIERERPEHAVDELGQVGSEQRLRPQRLEAERALVQELQAGRCAVQETRQEQRVAPHRKADQHAPHGAARGRALPEQSAEKGRRELRNRRKGQ